MNYPTLARSRQVCKLWKCLIDEKLPLPQRYILKYLTQFVNPARTLKRFEEIFLTPLSDKSVEKTVLDNVIEKLQEDLSATKEQAYQALLDIKLMQSCPSMKIIIFVNAQFIAEKGVIFLYIRPNLLNPKLQQISNLEVKIKRTGEDIIHIFGLKNLSIDFLSKVIRLSLGSLNLTDNQLSS